MLVRAVEQYRGLLESGFDPDQDFAVDKPLSVGIGMVAYCVRMGLKRMFQTFVWFQLIYVKDSSPEIRNDGSSFILLRPLFLWWK